MNDDNLDALTLSIPTIKEWIHKLMSNRTCPNCGHTYPNYPYYRYDKEKIYICPKCNHREVKK